VVVVVVVGKGPPGLGHGLHLETGGERTEAMATAPETVVPAVAVEEVERVIEAGRVNHTLTMRITTAVGTSTGAQIAADTVRTGEMMIVVDSTTAPRKKKTRLTLKTLPSRN
jgi:hypothetical protein